MKALIKVSEWIGNHVAIIVIVVALLALIVPSAFTWLTTPTVNWLLGGVMLCMGLTLRPQDFKIVMMKPLPVLIGCAAQFTVMPLLAWVLCNLFSLPTEIAIGVTLVGCCPGGTASNIMTYLAKGDVALSVCMTGISTTLAPMLTPFLTWLLVGETVDVDVWAMMLSVVQVVILPIVIGLVIKHYFGKFTDKFLPFLPTFSTIAVALIIVIVLSANAERVISSGLIIVAVTFLHNFSGLAFGFSIGHIMKLSPAQRNAISLEVGMQNSGLATSLAATHFAMYPLATIPGAIFSVWHNFTGAIAANVLRKYFSSPSKN